MTLLKRISRSFLLVACAVVLIVAPSLLVAAPQGRDALARERAACAGKDPDASIMACTGLLEGSAKLSAKERADILNSRGVAYGDKGRYDQAIRDLDMAVQLDPGNPTIFVNRGLAHRRNGDFDQAERSYVEAIRLDPRQPAVHNNLGFVYSQRSEFDRAIREYDEAIRLDPRFANAYANRGFALMAKGDLDRAAADFDQAIRADPKYPNPHRLRGLLLVQRGELGPAMRSYDDAIRLNPKYAVAYRNRGELFARIGDPDRALADLTEAIRLDPSEGAAYTARGLVLEQRNERARALADFRNATAVRVTGETRAGMADLRTAQEVAREHIAALTGGTAAVSAVPSPAIAAPAATSSPPVAATASAMTQTAVVKPSAFAHRVALVVGNSAYRFAPPLGNPEHDAGDMATALRRIGFDVVEGQNLDRRGMDDAVREFGRKLDRADLAVFFYAGHGLQVAGKNYLVPVDAKLERPGDLALDAVDVSLVLAQMEADKRVNLVFLDACRDNPLSRSLARSLGTRSASVGSGLASIQSALGTLIAYATQPDNVALDGEGRNSPFTTALLRHLATPGTDIGTVMRRVRADVVTATREKQVPWDHSSLIGEVVLVP
ncbi:MAG: tetratricopeptide repeat protein [Rhodoplanes sp.]|uniref:tetratricopeptide repeat protein n=1 Tax=Rhodoplanes sp. TaxID=1968906 RepID=UPI00182394B4|nr:tetratricopeptide repeat protein [Rhodoplanes sp.]NVO14654.1 tetratricopeptide repeat protein [Rhodoplanes sp.]